MKRKQPKAVMALGVYDKDGIYEAHFDRKKATDVAWLNGDKTINVRIVPVRRKARKVRK